TRTPQCPISKPLVLSTSSTRDSSVSAPPARDAQRPTSAIQHTRRPDMATLLRLALAHRQLRRNPPSDGVPEGVVPLSIRSAEGHERARSLSGLRPPLALARTVAGPGHEVNPSPRKESIGLGRGAQRSTIR